MIAVLSGGTGTPKLLQGLKQIYPEEEISVIVNTADDMELEHGYFSPDVDTVIYTFAGIINEETWYGIKNDTFKTHEMLIKLGYEEYLRIGDLDRASHIFKKHIMKKDKLCTAIELQAKALGVKAKIYPMSDERIETRVLTDIGDLHLQEFFVKHRAEPNIKDVYYRGTKKPCEKALKAIKKAEAVIIGPSNPITSILPILSIKEISEEIKKKKEKCLAVSPLIKGKPFSGVADKFMKAMNYEPNSKGVAEIYRDYIKYFLIDADEDEEVCREIEKMGIKCIKTNILMKTDEDKRKLAEFILKLLEIF